MSQVISLSPIFSFFSVLRSDCMELDFKEISYINRIKSCLFSYRLKSVSQPVRLDQLIRLRQPVRLGQLLSQSDLICQEDLISQSDKPSLTFVVIGKTAISLSIKQASHYKAIENLIEELTMQWDAYFQADSAFTNRKQIYCDTQKLGRMIMLRKNASERTLAL